MKPRSSLGFVFVLAGSLVVAGSVSLVQWRESVGLHVELERSKAEAETLARLRAENQRLREKQIPEAELARLRSDHAAIPRLRAELDALEKQTNPPGVKR